MNSAMHFFAHIDARMRLVIALSVVSGIGTSAGLFALMQAGGPVAIWSLSGAMAIVITVILQMLLLFALDQYAGNRQTPALGIYLLLMFGSVSMAQAFWTNVLRLDHMIADQQLTRSLEQTLGGLRANQQQFQRLAELARQTSELSTELARRERDEGYTCGRIGPGPGPRMEYRQQDARRFASFAASFDRLQHRVDGLIVQGHELAQGRPDRAAILKARGIVDEVNALRTTGEIAAFEHFMIQRFNEGRQGVVVQGAPIRCPLDELADHVRTLRALDFSPLPHHEVLDPSREGANVVYAFRTTLWFFTGQWNAIEHPQIVAIGLGALVDLAILWVMLSSGRGVGNALGRFREHRSLNMAMESSGLTDLLSARELAELRRFMIRAKGEYHLYVPERLANSALLRLEALGLARYVGKARSFQIPRAIRGKFADDEFHAVHYAIRAEDLLQWVGARTARGRQEQGEPT